MLFVQRWRLGLQEDQRGNQGHSAVFQCGHRHSLETHVQHWDTVKGGLKYESNQISCAELFGWVLSGAAT
jgi:hypothetical protein